MKVSAELNELVPVEWRRHDGWYEEDCEWSIAFTFLSELIMKGKDETSKRVLQDGSVARTLKAWYPSIHRSLYFQGALAL